MAQDESGGYDLARGFETLIAGEKATEQAIRDLQNTLVTLLSMNRNLGEGTGGDTTSSLKAKIQGLSAALQGQTTSQQLSGAPDSAATQDGMTSGQTVAAAPGSGGSGSGGGGGTTTKAPEGGADPNTQGIQGGSGQGAGEGLVRALPYADKVMAGLDEFRSQRDKNARYQAIVGGTNLGAMRNRWEEEKYRWSTAGIMSGEESRKTYYGLTAAGFREDGPEGRNMESASNFVEMGKSAGLSVDQGLAQMNTAALNPSLDLGDMEKAIQKVSAAAKEGGVNFSMLTEQLVTLTDQAARTGLGEGASQYASAMTVASAQRGTGFTANTDLSGTTEQGAMRRAYAVQGLTYNEGQALQANGTDSLSAGQDVLMDQAISASLSAEAQSWIKEQIALYPDLTENDVSNIIANYKIKFRGGMDLNAIMTIAANMTGKTYTSQDDALRDMIHQLAGNTATAASEDFDELDADALDGLGKKKNALGAATSGPLGGVVSPVAKLLGSTSAGESESAAAEAYVDRVNAGGEQNELLNGLFQNIGGSGADTTKVKVYGANGFREMTVEEALKEDESGEILRGAEFVDGEDIAGEDLAGKTVDEVAGLDALEDEGNKGLIGLTDEARKWFTYSSSSDQADSAGVPKPSLVDQAWSFSGGRIF